MKVKIESVPLNERHRYIFNDIALIIIIDQKFYERNQIRFYDK